MRRLLLAALVLIPAVPLQRAGAQIIRGGRMSLSEPQLWVSAGAGWQQGFAVTDGATGARWEFADAQSYGGSLERTINGGTSVALRASTSSVPLSYLSLATLGGARQADARVSQAFAGIHVSSGRGLHSVLELGAGATVYSNFTERGTGGAKLSASGTDADFTFVFGYGIGYSFNRAFQVDVVQDLATSLHQKTGLAAGESSSARISGTRVVARLGLGS